MVFAFHEFVKVRPTNINLVDLTIARGISITGTGGYIGYAVSRAGDINKDGFDEFIIVSYASLKGYVLYGNSTFSNIDLDSFTSNQGFTVTPGDGGSPYAK